eukprot:gene51684-biopygen41535
MKRPTPLAAPLLALLMAGTAFQARAIPVLAVLACLAAALSYGFAGVFGRRFRRMGIAPATVAFGQVAATTAMMIPLVVLVDAPWRLAMPSLTTLGALVGLGLLSTALAYIIAYGRPGASQSEIEGAARSARIHDF